MQKNNKYKEGIYLMNESLPNWANEVFQGLVYWIGYKQQLYNHYPIREGEIVGETLSLLSSKIDNVFRINAEVMYKHIVKDWDNNQRADIVISKKNKNFDYKEHALFVIEVKRKEAPEKEVDKDLERLAKLKEKNENIRCFLLYVSPNEKPKYVNDSGTASRKIITLPKNYIAQVRLVKKALNKFYTFKDGKKVNNAIQKAHYACLIEIGKEKKYRVL